IKFSRDLPSNFFIIHRGPRVLVMIMPMQKQKESKTELVYFVVNPNTGKKMEVPCNVDGEISQKRVEELLKLKIDSNAMILAGNLFMFNGVAYRIQQYERLKAEVMDMANKLIVHEEVKYSNKILL